MSHFDEMNRHATAAAGLLKALAHPERLMVLCQLVEGEKGVGELLAHSQLGQSAFSQQLSVLKRQGLIRSRKVSQQIYYSPGERGGGRCAGGAANPFCHSDEEIR